MKKATDMNFAAMTFEMFFGILLEKYSAEEVERMFTPKKVSGYVALLSEGKEEA